VQIHVYSAPESAFLVNSFIIEGACSLVVVDTQFLVSAARALKRQVAAIGKPVAAVLITHPHPDHFNGTGTLLDGIDAPVLATRRTAAGIAEIEADKRAYWRPIHGDDYPASTWLPDGVLEPGERLRIDDIELIVDELGAGESSNDCIIRLPQTDALIVSDLVYASCHPWLAEGRSFEWLHQLARLGARHGDARRIYPGHGPAGGPALIEAQRVYLETVRGLVSTALRGSRLTPELSVNLVAAIHARFPDHGLKDLVALNVAGIAAELEFA
jgi:glyoxylase-like metal-dependent hydrolase (beta-lactamase superfamily II)